MNRPWLRYSKVEAGGKAKVSWQDSPVPSDLLYNLPISLNLGALDKPIARLAVQQNKEPLLPSSHIATEPPFALKGNRIQRENRLQ
jgi:hypothetical protein